MAGNEIVIHVRGDTASAEKAFGRVRKNTDQLRRSMKPFRVTLNELSRGMLRFGTVLGGVGTAILGSAVLLAQGGAQNLALEESFKKLSDQAGLSADEIMAKLKEASAGTVTESDILKGAIALMTSGLSTDMAAFGTLMEIARTKAREMGTTTSEEFGKLVKGISEGNLPILESAGYLGDAEQAAQDYTKVIGVAPERWTPAMKTQAALNAVMLDGKDKIDKIALATLTASEQFEGMSAKAKNAKTAIGEELTVAVVGLMPALNSVVGLVVSLAKAFGNLPVGMQKTVLIAAAVAAVFGAVIVAAGLLAASMAAIIALAVPLGIALTIATGPIGLLVLAIVGLVAAGVILYQNWEAISAKAKEIWGAIVGYFKGVVADFKTVFNGLIALAEGWANGWIKGINAITGALNKIKFDIPSWVPGIGGKSFGINIPPVPSIALPRLAQGGQILGAGAALVGEKGPELLSLPGGAQIAPLPQGNRGGSTAYITFNLNVSPGGVVGMTDLDMHITRVMRDALLAGGFRAVLQRV